MSITSQTGDRWSFGQSTTDWSTTYRGEHIKYPIMDLDERVRKIEERLLIIDPLNESLAEKYPALAEAYKEYKIIERLTLGNDKTT